MRNLSGFDAGKHAIHGYPQIWFEHVRNVMFFLKFRNSFKLKLSQITSGGPHGLYGGSGGAAGDVLVPSMLFQPSKKVGDCNLRPSIMRSSHRIADIY